MNASDWRPAAETVRVAAVQHPPVLLDRDATVNRAVTLIEEAAEGGARIIAFPETWIPGYPAWIYGAARTEDPVAKAAFGRLHEQAVAVPGPATDVLCAAAREHSVELVVGINEIDDRFSRGTLYNAQLFISAEGEIRGVHRKVMPTHAERIVWGYGDGSSLHVFDTEHGRLGGLICWEHWMPITRFVMHSQGEMIHVAAWPMMPELHHIATRSYAFEARAFVICAASYLPREAIPNELKDLYDDPFLVDASGVEVDDVLYGGGSGVIGPDGNWIAGPVWHEETIIYADCDLSQIRGEFQAYDSVGHYNRPDLYTVTVDRSPREPLAWIGHGRESDGARDVSQLEQAIATAAEDA